MISKDKHHVLKQLPGVDHLMVLAMNDPRLQETPVSVIKTAIRRVLKQTRQAILSNTMEQCNQEQILTHVASLSAEIIAPRLRPVINATGVVLHTNLGRSLLASNALENITTIAGGYSNLEFNITTGKRGLRYDAVEQLICELTGAEAAIAVNNNAGAVLLCLDTLAKGREVVVSRGELVEIGGSFRIPDVMTKSGCILKEVGTTNRTHARDYENAIHGETGLLMKVHTSNYRIQGFTKTVPLKDLVTIGQKNHIPIMEDLGSGSLIDLSSFGLGKEPTVAQAVSTGADIVTFSGDKLLGGPQAGIIVGGHDALDKIKANPLTRALRIDKLTLAALEATLSLYRDEKKALKQIPILRMLTIPFETITTRADRMVTLLKNTLGSKARVATADLSSRTGGGAFPEVRLPSRCVTITAPGMSAARMEKAMRNHTPAIIGRIDNERFIMDPRTLQKGEENIIASALRIILCSG
ncbi:L-seryl-tRNA(Sec) selenium transferase [Desulfocicer vacuolatum DSM 3385]|uniref:L-seryl-tRNA(Sec) selenium transferase n=1 Tax=Desulfocicer vacuolatum DSM 3385 TaxID=1121400 RepID=A0A1W1YHT5_9BACT|nr:L-seryl-tRNA(Sec) selenium transferase [Desulfocicer vacuolatum]SMC35686.1 L-seryl-tRNA(Sec) selenium transferase [Desulfocicer vacuolatum DSM 3385]